MKLESESLAGRLRGGGRGGQRAGGRGRKTGRGLALTTQTSSREWELLYNGQVARLHNLHTPAGKKRERKKPAAAAAAAWHHMIGLPIPPWDESCSPLSEVQHGHYYYYFFFF